MKPKIKWKVAEKETGRYASFHKRGWPDAYYSNGDIAAALYCDDSYCPRLAKTGEHGDITVRIADYSTTPWRWRTLVKRCKTLPDAKSLVDAALGFHQTFIPKDIKH